jgi:hypothetical protein
MARYQVLNAADIFKAVITTAAWKSKPSWMLVVLNEVSLKGADWFASVPASRISRDSHRLSADSPQPTAQEARLLWRANDQARYSYIRRAAESSDRLCVR